MNRGFAAVRTYVDRVLPGISVFALCGAVGAPNAAAGTAALHIGAGRVAFGASDRADFFAVDDKHFDSPPLFKIGLTLLFLLSRPLLSKIPDAFFRVIIKRGCILFQTHFNFCSL